MRVVGVVDLLGGRAVHARGGERARYAPIATVAGAAIAPGDAPSLVRAYRRAGVSDVYAADLDAILSPDADASPHAGLIASLASPRLPLWLDAGVSSVDRARRAVALGADRVVVGLETLPSYVVLEEICAAIGRDRVVFSLDLRDGRPVVRDHGIPAGDAVDVVAAHGADAGVGAVIVLDLARVGEGGGPDVEVIARVREAAPAPLLLAGGGVRGLTDLARLAEIGCDGALVATALLDGRLSAADVRMAAGYRNARR